MNTKTLAWVLLIPFLGLTVYALLEVGYFGIFEYHLHSPAGWQVFTDLVLSLLLILIWLVPHAKAHGRNPWIFVAITLAAGVIGPLLYLATAPSKEAEAATSG